MNLLDQYESHFDGRENTADTAIAIYKSLIDEGVLCNELVDPWFTMTLLEDKISEDALEALSEDLANIAFVDYALNDGEFGSDLFEYQSKDKIYTVSLIRMNLDISTKITEAVPHVFTALKDITLYVDNKCVVEAAENIINSRDADIGTFGLLAVEDAVDALETLGVEGMQIAEQIPQDAVAVIILIKTNNEHSKMFDSDMYVIYEVTEYIARI